MTSAISWDIKKYMRHMRPQGRLYVFMALWSHANQRNRAWLSIESIADLTGFSVPTVCKAQEWLIETGAIRKVPLDERSGDEKKLRTDKNVYELNPFITIEGVTYNLLLTANPTNHLNDLSEPLKPVKGNHLNDLSQSLTNEDNKEVKTTGAADTSQVENSENVTPVTDMSSEEIDNNTPTPPAPAAPPSPSEPRVTDVGKNDDDSPQNGTAGQGDKKPGESKRGQRPKKAGGGNKADGANGQPGQRNLFTLTDPETGQKPYCNWYCENALGVDPHSPAAGVLFGDGTIKQAIGPLGKFEALQKSVDPDYRVSLFRLNAFLYWYKRTYPDAHLPGRANFATKFVTWTGRGEPMLDEYARLLRQQSGASSQPRRGYTFEMDALSGQVREVPKDDD